LKFLLTHRVSNIRIFNKMLRPACYQLVSVLSQ
jgi:hypothetical protein